jgi:hypothetical protein
MAVGRPSRIPRATLWPMRVKTEPHQPEEQEKQEVRDRSDLDFAAPQTDRHVVVSNSRSSAIMPEVWYAVPGAG